MVEKSGVEKSRVEMSSLWTFLGLFNPRLFNHELFNTTVQKIMVEKSEVEKFIVDKSGVERSGLDLGAEKLRYPSTAIIPSGVRSCVRTTFRRCTPILNWSE